MICNRRKIPCKRGMASDAKISTASTRIEAKVKTKSVQRESFSVNLARRTAEMGMRDLPIRPQKFSRGLVPGGLTRSTVSLLLRSFFNSNHSPQNHRKFGSPSPSPRTWTRTQPASSVHGEFCTWRRIVGPMPSSQSCSWDLHEPHPGTLTTATHCAPIVARLGLLGISLHFTLSLI